MDWTAGISAYNWIDQSDAVLSSDEALLTGPVANLATYEAGVPFIAGNLSLTSGVFSVTATFGKAREVGCLGFLISERQDDAADVDFEPYVASEDLVRWKLSSDPDVGDGDLYDTADLAAADGDGRIGCDVNPRLGVHGLKTATIAGVRRVDFEFKKVVVAAAPLDIVRLGRMWAGPYKEFETSHDWGAETGWDEDELRHMVRLWSAPFNWIPEEVADADHIAYDYLNQVAQQVGKRKQVFFWPRSDSPSEAFFARFSNASKFRSRFITNMSTSNMGRAFSWAPQLQEDWLGV